MVSLSKKELDDFEKIANAIWDERAAKLESMGINGNEILAEIIKAQQKYGESPK